VAVVIGDVFLCFSNVILLDMVLGIFGIKRTKVKGRVSALVAESA
jgi:hypothetical protein